RSSGWRRRRTTRNGRWIPGSLRRWTAPITGPSSPAGAGSAALRRRVRYHGAPTEPPMDYAEYKHLTFERKPHGVVLITIDRPDVLNATNDRLHWELTQIWRTLDADDTARVAVVTGRGRAFSAGGDLDMVEANARDPR